MKLSDQELSLIKEMADEFLGQWHPEAKDAVALSERLDIEWAHRQRTKAAKKHYKSLNKAAKWGELSKIERMVWTELVALGQYPTSVSE